MYIPCYVCTCSEVFRMCFHMFSPVFRPSITLFIVVPLRNIYRLPLWFPHANAVLELNTSSDRLVSGRLGMTRICSRKSVVYIRIEHVPPPKRTKRNKSHSNQWFSGDILVFGRVNWFHGSLMIRWPLINKIWKPVWSSWHLDKLWGFGIPKEFLEQNPGNIFCGRRDSF